MTKKSEKVTYFTYFTYSIEIFSYLWTLSFFFQTSTNIKFESNKIKGSKSGGRRGTHIGRWYKGCAAFKIPFFRPHFSSGDTPFQALFQLQRPHFHFFEKKFAFQDLFLLILTEILAPETIILAKSQLSFKPKNQFRRHIPTKFLSTTAPGVPSQLSNLSNVNLQNVVQS